MKATELRIGNLVFSKETKNIQKITGLTENIPFIDDVITFDYQNYDEIEPIPLTEVWLIKLGFEKDNIKIIGKKKYNKFFGDYSIIISLCLNEKNQFEQKDYYLDTGEYYGFVFNNKKLHVHQLQNLYFALTGEELTIKQ